MGGMGRGGLVIVRFRGGVVEEGVETREAKGGVGVEGDLEEAVRVLV